MSSTPSVQQDPESVTRPPTFLELACGDKKEKYQFLKAYTTLYGRHALLAKLSTLAHKQKEHNNTKRHAQDEGWFDEARLQDLILSRAQLPEPMRHEKERQEFHEVKALLARNCASEYEYQAFLVRRGAELHDLSRRDRDIFRAYKLDARDARYTADKHEAYAIRHGRSFRVHEAALQKRRRPGPDPPREPGVIAAEDGPGTQEQEDFDGSTSSPDQSNPLGSPRQHGNNHQHISRHEHVHSHIHHSHHEHIHLHTPNRRGYPDAESFRGRRAPRESAVEAVSRRATAY